MATHTAMVLMNLTVLSTIAHFLRSEGIGSFTNRSYVIPQFLCTRQVSVLNLLPVSVLSYIFYRKYSTLTASLMMCISCGMHKL